jgi:hypothetical protein
VSALLELAARCEAAAGPSFALDIEIAYAINHPLEGLAKPYTASIDAARTLVPEEHDLFLMQGHGEKASAATPHRQSAITDERSAATPALALCAASLRARAALETGDAS